MTLCGLLASVAIPTEDTVHRWTLRPLFVAFILVLLFLFVKNIAKTLKGYSVLMLKRTNEDGSLPEKGMLDAVNGKLTEVVCESAPQSVHQVLSFAEKKFFLLVKLVSFISSDRSSYSDSVLLLVRKATFSDFEHLCQYI